MEPRSADPFRHAKATFMIATPTTSEHRDTRQGSALFSYGFRPFFLFGSVYAALLIALWVPWFLGLVGLPTVLPPAAWHAHELLFGYVAAAISGFLLTALPSWTGRAPITGLPLAALFGLWLAGRVAVSVSSRVGYPLTVVLCPAFPVALAAVAAREMVAGRNWRNLKVLLLLAVLLVSQVVFHWEVWHYGRVDFADRVAIAATLVLIMLIAGRIIPSFTANWLKARGETVLPVPFAPYDLAAVVTGSLALLAWATDRSEMLPAELVGGVLFLAAGLHLYRQSRWRPHRTLSEPLVTILHAAYLFVPVGFALAAFAALTNSWAADTAALHAWSTGAIGTMTLAVMTRASLGHTGRPLEASRFTGVIYLAVIVSAVARIAVALWPEWTMVLMPVTGLAWVVASLGFAVAYGPLLVTARSSG